MGSRLSGCNNVAKTLGHAQGFSRQNKQEEYIAMGRLKLAKRPAQFSAATLMLLAALSAVAIHLFLKISEKIAKLERVRAGYAAKAESHARFRKTFEMGLKNEPKSGFRDWLSEQARYYGDLEKKYAKAASSPWTAVEPDPPRLPLVPTDEQLSKWKSSKTCAELHEVVKADISHSSKFAIQPYVPRKLSDLKSP